MDMVWPIVDVNSVNRFSGTALLPSSENGYAKTVQYCLASGVSVNHINRLGWTALHEAVILGDGGYLYTLVIQLLIEAGADKHIKDRQGITPYEYAKQSDQTAVVHLFEDKLVNDLTLEDKLFVLYKEEYYDEALVMTQEALSRDNQKGNLHFWKGFILQEAKNYKSAIIAYRKGLELDTEDIQFYFYIANCYRLMQQPEDALKTFDVAIEENPENSFLLYHKSNYLRELSRHPQAIGVMKQLLDKSPERTDYLFHKANSLRASNKHRDAIQTIDLAIALDGDNDLFTEHRNQSLKLLET
ncbi:ankyrin repeat domain-containing protein [Planococcus versutus]|uniref:Tetratricopeptide repeat protein n=1 Tax=Planococcus versutus TaxID=1302659 RepID=A0A1B1S1A4_9BACL|nr:ankyrin repeat domain-containing protein [Planococcus versutus]ANU26944.1 hypothetical protein I858_008045 [Planococcus versutus]